MVDGENRSELLAADWNGEWMRLQAGRRRADDSFEWDKRARHFRPLETAPYARDFIKLLALKPGESVLDMGCGAGSIAIPLAQAGHSVIATTSARSVGRLLHGSRSLRPAHSLFAARTAHSLGIRILFELGKRAPHRTVPALSWDSSRKLRPRRGAPHT